MDIRKLYRYGFGILVSVLLWLSFGLICPLNAQTSTISISKEVPKEQVEDLIRVLEDEETRTVFLQRLKALAQIKAETLPAEPSEAIEVLPRVIIVVEKAIQQMVATVQNITDWLERMPQHWNNFRAVILSPEIHQTVYRTIRHLGLAFIPAFGVGIILYYILGLLRRLTLPDSMRPALQQGWQALVQIMATALSIVGFLIVSMALLRVFHADLQLRETMRLLLFIILTYQIVSQSSRFILAPDDETMRWVPLSDENANYLSIWIHRFLLYGLAYAVVIYGLGLLYEEPQTYQGIRGVLLCLFPSLVTIFVAQVVRQRREQPTSPQSETEPRMRRATLRLVKIFWPFLTILYAWVLTIFLVMHRFSNAGYLFWSSVKTVLTGLVLIQALRLLNRLFDHVFRISDRLRQRYPLLEERANRYVQVLRNVCSGLVVLLAIGIIFEFWGIPAFGVVTSPLGVQLLTRSLIIAIAIGLAGIAISILKIVANILLQSKIDDSGVLREPDRKRKTLVPLGHAVLRIGVFFAAALVVLDQIGINITPILAGVGILGLAIGFGAQSLVKDIINGLFILFEDSLSVGDVAILRGTGGLVEKITLRTVTLRDLSGNVHVIPNSSIDMVTNMTKEYSRYLLEVGVAYREDVDGVIEILKEIDEGMRADPEYGKDMLEPIEILGLDRFADSAIIVRARLKTRPIQQWRIGREFNRRMKKVFDERDVEIPFPHRTVYWGVPKEAPQSPIHLAMENEKVQSDKRVP